MRWTNKIGIDYINVTSFLKINIIKSEVIHEYLTNKVTA